MRVLITGITGFVGSFLAEECAGRGWEVHGTSHHLPATDSGSQPSQALPESVAGASIHKINLVDGAATAALVADVRPDHIYHLAAQASVPEAWHDPTATVLNNIAAQMSILEALRMRAAPRVRLLIVSTAEVYGGVAAKEMPIRETAPLQPLNPYAVSKATQDMLGYQYYRAYGQHIVRVRPFNHFGPRQRTGFVAADFAKQIAEIERRRHPPLLRVGNLTARRDFTDVRDIARAYTLALELGEPGAVYNICSGVGRPVRALLDGLLDASSVPIEVEPEPERMRPVDYPVVVGDSSAFRARAGWQPRIPFDQTVRDTLNYWRERVVSDE